MSLPSVRVSENGRFLITEDGSPFFYLGDTAWELFHRLTLEEADLYLTVRSNQGFNVVQAVILAELDGLHTPNANGHIPLIGDDPTKPNEYYFRHVDSIIRLAEKKGIYMGILPTWGDKVHSGLWGIGPAIFDKNNAYLYGKFLGERYRDFNNIVWILGGDRPGEGYEDIWTSMAKGISDGLGRKPIITYHPTGGQSSSQWFHNMEWLSFNMWQSGHCLVDAPNWDMIRSDYDKTPIKPVIDGEPNYEGHPIDPYLRKWKPEYGRFTDYEVRKQAYRAVFSGACGHTYGHHSVWQMYDERYKPTTFPNVYWYEAIYAPGAKQMIHLKNLLLSFPYFTRIPAQDMLIGITPPPPPKGIDDRINDKRASHPVATRDKEGSYALIYFPLANQPLNIDTSSLLGCVIKASWFDPRTGERYYIGEFSKGTLKFTSPLGGPDWVLILEV